MATATDDNAADGEIGSADCHKLQVVSTLVQQKLIKQLYSFACDIIYIKLREVSFMAHEINANPVVYHWTYKLDEISVDEAIFFKDF